MKRLFTLLIANRLMGACVALCLILGPFDANCCGRHYCELSNPEANSGSPCHGGMSAEHRPAIHWENQSSKCVSEFIALQSIWNAEPFGRVKIELEVRASVGALPSENEITVQAGALGKSDPRSQQPARASFDITALTQLNL